MGDERTEDETARATSELRHRMANTLQLLSALSRMRSQRASEPETRRQLIWMADAIGSLGALERHRTEAGVDFAAYLQEMSPIWRRRHSTRQVELVAACDPILTPDTAASTLALIVQELVGNALLHGCSDTRPGRIEVRVARLDGDRCELTVSDDGDGFDPAAAASRERFGLWFVRSLAAQVRGEFSLIPKPGVTCRLVFSL